MPDRELPAESDERLMDVLVEKLGPPGEEASPLPQIELLRALRTRGALWRRREDRKLDPVIGELFGLVAQEPADLDQLTPDIAARVQKGLDEGLSREEMPHVFQAYVRAVSRVVAAEAASIRSVLEATPPDARPERLALALDHLLPIGAGGFELMRRMMLLDALVDEVSQLGSPAQARDSVIAMVDIVGSTRYLATSGTADLEALVDALFAASQAATLQHAVFVVKYVGDGVFLAGREAEEVADVALEVITRLEEALPLRARGGLAAGDVVQRAGDLFGLPVNVALLVSKAAQPGRLLATEGAAERLPAARRGRYRTVDLPHPALEEIRVATVRARDAAPV